MKKNLPILILFFFGFSFELFSQNFEFKLYHKNPCNSETELAHNYFLLKNGIKYYPNFDGIVKLKSKGKYSLIREKEIIPIMINKKENSDTITLSRIQEFFITHDKHGYIFHDCGSKLNGNIIDYFENGKVRMIGNFKKD